jgi:hypothetical protein
MPAVGISTNFTTRPSQDRFGTSDLDLFGKALMAEG